MKKYDFEAMDFIEEEAKQASSGDCVALSRAFLWRASVEGYVFWAKQYERCKGSRGMSEQGKAAITAMLDQYESEGRV